MAASVCGTLAETRKAHLRLKSWLERKRRWRWQVARESGGFGGLQLGWGHGGIMGDKTDRLTCNGKGLCTYGRAGIRENGNEISACHGLRSRGRSQGIKKGSHRTLHTCGRGDEVWEVDSARQGRRGRDSGSLVPPTPAAPSAVPGGMDAGLGGCEEKPTRLSPLQRSETGEGHEGRKVREHLWCYVRPRSHLWIRFTCHNICPGSSERMRRKPLAMSSVSLRLDQVGSAQEI